MTEKNLVTIVLATYQGELFLREQLDSLVEQTYKPIEIHIHDDGSTDQTLSIIKEYLSKYKNIKLFKNTSNLGYVKNFEKGINNTHSQYIALSDQDDIWQKDKIKKQMTLMTNLEGKNPDTPILIHSDLCFIDIANKTIYNSYFKYRGFIPKNEQDHSLALGYSCIMGNTILMNKKLSDISIPFPPNLKNHDYWLGLVNEFQGIRGVVKDSLVKYRQHANNASNSKKIKQPIKKSMNFFIGLISQNAILHFINDNGRKDSLEFFLKNYELNSPEKSLIQDFIRYLEMRENRVKLAHLALKRGFIRGSFLFKLAFILEFITSKRYSINK